MKLELEVIELRRQLLERTMTEERAQKADSPTHVCWFCQSTGAEIPVPVGMMPSPEAFKAAEEKAEKMAIEAEKKGFIKRICAPGCDCAMCETEQKVEEA